MGTEQASEVKKDTKVTLTVNTDTITETTKNTAVGFTDNRGDTEIPGDPQNYVSWVDKNKKITWEALALNGTTPVFIQNVKKDGGSAIMEQIGRDNAHNKYKAKIKNKDYDPPNDTESYSITISIAGYEGIAGNNENGPIIFVGSQLTYMNVYQDNVWHSLPNAPFSIEGITGDNVSGPIVYAGFQVAHIGMTGSNWTIIAPSPFQIEGITGDNHSGPMIYSGSLIYYMDKYVDNVWLPIAVPAPFYIEGIAGNNVVGPIVYNGNQVAHFNKANNTWQMAALAPFDIEGIACNNASGPVAYAGKKVAHLNFATNTWQQVANAPFIIEGIAGNQNGGPIVFADKNIAYMSDYSSNLWTSRNPIPLEPKSFCIDPKIRVHS